MIYEYRVVPAPRRGEKARGVKTTADRFAYALTVLMNDMAADGWEYQRADTLPCDERSGFTGTATTYQAVMVFRRARGDESDTAVRIEAENAVTGPRLDIRPDRLDGIEGTSMAPRLGPADRLRDDEPTGK